MSSNYPYVNAHTHISQPSDEIAIYNQNPESLGEIANTYFSIGLHPWKIKAETVSIILNTINELSTHKNALAIGECGIDKLIDIDLKEQESIFKAQIKIAEALQKPIIIHCVKAFDDLIRIKKEMNVSVPMIVHGYNNNQEIATQLIKNGFYFSFGKAILKADSNASKVISMIPFERLFLETDDATISIQDIYEDASKRLGINVALLKQTIYNNFKRVFLKDFLR